MRQTLLIALLAGLVPVADAAGVESVTAEKPFAHSVRPRQIAEECFKLPAGQAIGYAFEASAPVDFNIHYHVGKDVVYPVKGDQVRQAVDRFTAPSDQDFCLMWTNATLEMVTVKGRLAP
jgi:hypothetical protein